MLYIAIYWLRKKYGFLPFVSKIWVNDEKWDGTKLTRHIVLETASLVGTTCLPKFAYGSRSDEPCVRRLFIDHTQTIHWRNTVTKMVYRWRSNAKSSKSLCLIPQSFAERDVWFPSSRSYKGCPRPQTGFQPRIARKEQMEVDQAGGSRTK